MSTQIRSNAWTGPPSTDHGPASGEFGPGRLRWTLGESAGRKVDMNLKPTAPDPADWRDPRVGWGVVLPARQELSDDELATGDDAPEAIRHLVAERETQTTGGWQVPIFRYHPELDPTQRLMFLRNHRTGRDLRITGSGVGVEDHQIPSYLLIAAPPSEVPWEFQYILSAQRLVGRLDLDDEGLGHYVEALLGDFANDACDPRASVTWAVTHGDPADITHTLRRMVSRKIHRRLLEDDDLANGAHFVDGRKETATGGSLAAALAAARPGLIVTSSHGKTGPVGTPEMAADLGLPVDQEHRPLDVDDLLADWQPAGAVWLAHACCSAGAAARSAYDGLFADDDPLGRMLAAVASLGDRVAPLPSRLLGHSRPLRAFIGQVEPTFDWTLQDPSTGQPLTNQLCDSLYPNLYLPQPIGLAFDPWNDLVDGYNRTWFELRDAFNAESDPARSQAIEKELLLPRLAAVDVQSTVILGDPTVMLPSL